MSVGTGSRVVIAINTIASISTGSFHFRKAARARRTTEAPRKYHFIHRKKKYRSTATGEIGTDHLMTMKENEFAPITPGEMLKEEFLAAYGLSRSRLAKAVGISPNQISEIVNNRRRITADTALRLGLYFGNSPEFWMNVQSHCDLKMARRNLTPEEREAYQGERAA